ncbi:pirin-like [Ptychodera flava]|uniref:pirin-like n=1 Tax=Ptychodera flava TaxID=63121 RepID=UPI00396A58D0
MERSVKEVVTAHQQREGGGFLVRRPIGGKIKMVDPFILLDHVGPVDHKPGEAIGAPDHPHRGFETVSYIIEGSLHHKDSVGNEGHLKSGWVQWMTAGSGVVHSEMPGEDMIKNGGRMEATQLWVNLRSTDKFVSPRYQDTPAEKIPVVKTPDGKAKVKVIAGTSLGTQAVIETRSPMMYLDIHLEPGASFTQEVHESFNGFAYVRGGSGYLGHDLKPAKMGQVGVLTEGSKFTMKAADDQSCDILLIAGQPLNEPVVHHGPFVMNTKEQIQQAIKDYHSGMLGKIAGSEMRYQQTEAAKQKQKETGTWSQ